MFVRQRNCKGGKSYGKCAAALRVPRIYTGPLSCFVIIKDIDKEAKVEDSRKKKEEGWQLIPCSLVIVSVLFLRRKRGRLLSCTQRGPVD